MAKLKVFFVDDLLLGRLDLRCKYWQGPGVTASAETPVGGRGDEGDGYDMISVRTALIRGSQS